MVSGGLISLLIWLVIIGLIFYLLYWLVDQLPLPSPWSMVARVLIGLVAVIILLDILLPMAGPPPSLSFLRH